MDYKKLNDGIFHPYYNENGWRRIKKQLPDGSYEMIYWYEDTDGIIKSVEDCFNPNYINPDDKISGRTDELIFANVFLVSVDEFNSGLEYPENSIVLVYEE